MSKVLSFKDLKNKVDKSSILVNSEDIFNNQYGNVSTGNYMLNALLSASLLGGYPENRIISLGGEKGTGKTFLCLNAVREYQKAGYSVKYYDSEGAISRELVENFGCDTSDEVWDYKLISTVEEFRIDCTNTVQTLIDAKRGGYEIPKMLFILDSAGNLASEKEVTDALAGNQKVDMTRAKVLKSVFRILTSKLAEVGASFIFTNHIYKTTDLFARTISGGGSGPQYAASIMLQLTKAQLKEGDSKTGIIVTATTEKNRFARPEKIKFHIHYKKGMNPYIGLHEYLSWDNCGIENGKIVDELEYQKLFDKHGSKNEELFETISDTQYQIDDENYYFIDVTGMKKLKITGVKKFAVRHLASEVEVVDLFTDKVFNEDTLAELDKTVIYDKFSYGVTVKDSFDEVFSEEVEEDQE
jgi:RecA/RadA recombinase